MISVIGTLVLLFTLALSGEASIPTRRPHVELGNCTDPVYCAKDSCTSVLSTEDGECVELPAGVAGNVVPGVAARFECSFEPRPCAPVQVFWNDPNCTNPMQIVYLPCESCLQFPPRYLSCGARNDTFELLISSVGANDTMCAKPGPRPPRGTAPGECYAHPGVPGLYLLYNNLETCAVLVARGYSTKDCSGSPISETVLATQAKCMGGITARCRLP
jgi:hypothetical protein